VSGTWWLSLVVAAVLVGATHRRLLAQPATPPAQPTTDAPANETRAATQPALQPLPAETPGLAALLIDPATSPQERDEIARRLAARQTPESQQALLAAVVQTANPRAQLAVARALATDPNPPADAFIVPLGALIGQNVEQTDAAVAALVRYRNNDNVAARLLGTAVNPPPTVSRAARIAVIRGLAAWTDKRTAEALVGLALNEAEQPSVRASARYALAELTGQRDDGSDPQRWRKWWAEHEQQPEAQFRADILAARAAERDRLLPRFRRFSEEVSGLLTDQYNRASDARREEILLSYLRSGVPEVRVLGARLIRDDFVNDRRIPALAKERLRQMVGDSSSEVRLAVARALHDINDTAALDALLAQLRQERVPEVQAALAEALGKTQSVRAVPPLLELLGQEGLDPAVVEAVVDALKGIGPALAKQDPELAAQASRRLEAVLPRTTSPEMSDLRERIVDAMVPLRNPELRNLFVGLLKPHEPPRVRRNAVRALGEFRQPWAATNIVNAGALDDEDPAVRLAAVQAMGKTIAPEHANTLLERLRADVEPAQEVRDEAWRVLESWFPEFDKERLSALADRFMKEQPQRRVTILRALEKKLADEKDLRNLAITQQNVGETLMKLQRPQEAAAEFAAALKFYRDNNEQNQFTEELVRLLMEAYLVGGDYARATEFAQQSLSLNDSYQRTVGSLIQSTAGELKNQGRLQDAQVLVNLAVQMNPPLKEPFLSGIQRIAEELREKLPRPAGAAGDAQSAAADRF
jgi:HEAT repeat protein